MQRFTSDGNQWRDPIAEQCNSARLMWLTHERLFYCGLLGQPSERTMGSIVVYVAVEGSIRISIGGDKWEVSEAAIIPPYTPHRISSESRFIYILKIEAETVDMANLPDFLTLSGAVDIPWFVDRVRQSNQTVAAKLGRSDLSSSEFDHFFFDTTLPKRAIDSRIAAIIDKIKRDPSCPSPAEESAAAAHLSYSRFLHLFKQEVGVPFRSFRAWKRARSLLYRVNRDENLANVALNAGYPDSTHFSHSIRHVFGLKPRDIFAGSRRLAIHVT